MAQELRITLKAIIPIGDADAFATAERISAINAELKTAIVFVAGQGGHADISSRLVAPRKRDDAAGAEPEAS